VKRDDDQMRNNGFAERFKSIRVKNSLSQKQYSAALMVSVPSICRLEQGKATPDANLILRIVVLYKCDLVWLMTGQGNAVGDIGMSGKGQLLSQISRDPEFRAEVLNELGLRSPNEVIRNQRVYALLLAQRTDWQAIVELTENSVKRASAEKRKEVLKGVEGHREGIAYLDVLLEIGLGPEHEAR
jgi:transcriptional regulator with XRE-family HTH domain